MPRGGARIGAGRKRKVAALPQDVMTGAPGAPAWLSPLAREFYAHNEAQLGDRMTPGDRDGLACYATALSLIASGHASAPLLGVAKSWAQALGLTPTSRDKAKPAGKAEAKKDWRAVVYQMPAR